MAWYQLLYHHKNADRSPSRPTYHFSLPLPVPWQQRLLHHLLSSSAAYRLSPCFPHRLSFLGRPPGNAHTTQHAWKTRSPGGPCPSEQCHCCSGRTAPDHWLTQLLPPSSGLRPATPHHRIQRPRMRLAAPVAALSAGSWPSPSSPSLLNRGRLDAGTDLARRIGCSAEHPILLPSWTTWIR
uniref:Uncharacterized protein n=1 Tax=Arundo donax TaxID=35708 RepID=A0A0A9CXL9_ARUDO